MSIGEKLVLGLALFTATTLVITVIELLSIKF